MVAVQSFLVALAVSSFSSFSVCVRSKAGTAESANTYTDTDALNNETEDWWHHKAREDIHTCTAGNCNALSRGERLCAGGLSVLYHQTDRHSCEIILKNGFDMGRATAGNQGLGTYFADNAAVTGYKTRHTGCVIKALVRLGRVFDMGNHWLPGVHRLPDGCDPLFGYNLNKEHFDSVTTIKHGRERALFFTDQIIDLIAYPTGNYYKNKGEVRGGYINGRSQFKYPATCNPKDFPEYQPPPCNFTGQVMDKACASGFSDAGCFTRPDGNVVADAKCTGAKFLKFLRLDFNACEKSCHDEPDCKGFEHSWGNACKQFSTVPRSYQAGAGSRCLKKI